MAVVQFLSRKQKGENMPKNIPFCFRIIFQHKDCIADLKY